jgi:hypothetical protein
MLFFERQKFLDRGRGILRLRTARRYQIGNRLAAIGNGELLASLNLPQQLRQLRLGLVGSDLDLNGDVLLE